MKDHRVVTVPKDLHKRIKAYVNQHDIKISHWVAGVLTEALAKEEKGSRRARRSA